mmetsp:Transcript_1756/g.2147  ORF Transcript_1756/g.2147 Transcript_1756/m.2147 type:complete len:401 (-) Transcript_1756:26-1228(-)
MASRVLVVGSGVIGLRTALELLRKNVSVVLKSARPPLHPSTCSVGAGGLWMPYKCDDPRIDKWSLETLDELLAIAKDENKKDQCIEIVPTIFLLSSNKGPDLTHFVNSDYSTKTSNDMDAKQVSSPLPKWSSDPRLSFQHLSIEMLTWQNSVFKLRIPSQNEMLSAGYTHAYLFHPPIVDPPRMLMTMLNEIKFHPKLVDMNIEMGEGYSSLKEMVEDAENLKCDAIINCTGLGAANICKDPALIGGRGVLLHYDRSCARRETGSSDQELMRDAAILTEEGKWGSRTDPSYIIPRGDVFVVGGTYKEEDYEQGIRNEERKKIKQNAWDWGIDTERVDPIGEWTGFRPCRPNVRLEVDSTNSSADMKVVHSYGAGGSGWTIFAGIAKRSVDLLFSSEKSKD